MSMPQIPKQPHRPSFDEVILDLMESIALEEIALSHLIKAEAEKIKAFVGDHRNFPSKPSTSEIIKFNRSVTRLMDTVLFKEFLLIRKLELVVSISETEETCKEEEEEEDEE